MGIDREDFVGTKLTEGYLKFVGKIYASLVTG